jgi:hypothetical protein
MKNSEFQSFLYNLPGIRILVLFASFFAKPNACKVVKMYRFRIIKGIIMYSILTDKRLKS